MLELRAGDGDVHVVRAVPVLAQEREHDLRAHLRGELLLRLLGGLAHAQHRRGIAREIDLFRLFEFGDEVVGQPLIEVVAAEVVVAAGGQHLDDAVADLDERDVERAAAQIIDEDLLRLPVVKAVGERRGGRLVDDAQHLQPGDASGILGRLALGVGEVRRHGDDRLRDALAEVRLRVAAQLLQDHRGDLLRRIALAVDFDLVIVAHLALDGEHRAARVDRLLPARGLADDALAALHEADDGGRRAPALGIGDDDRLAALHDGDAAVGRAQIDTDNPAHYENLPLQVIVRLAEPAAPLTFCIVSGHAPKGKGGNVKKWRGQCIFRETAPRFALDRRMRRWYPALCGVFSEKFWPT